MRISDWSSDVCSSDLRAASRRFDFAANLPQCAACGSYRGQGADDHLALAIDAHGFAVVRRALKIDDQLRADAEHIAIADLAGQRTADPAGRFEHFIAALEERGVVAPSALMAFAR